MRISINSTFSYIKFNLNYGSALQCYALQQYLKSRGHYVEHLRDYRANPIYILKRFKNIKYFPLFAQKLIAIWKLQKFIRSNLTLSKRGYLSDNKLNKHGPDVDCYIVGSDQIWHNANKFRYLTYVPDGKLKLSYAASFGRASISDEMKATIQPWLKRFNGISVRERSAVDIISSMGMKAEWVLDPTLLLDWEKYPLQKNTKYKNYCYCYFLNLSTINDIPMEAIKTVSKNMGNHVIITAPLNYMFFQGKDIVFPSVEEWLGLYKNADCIFTNTYHGLLFCIIFKKQFVFFMQMGGAKIENERFLSVLELLHLEDRVFRSDPEEIKRLEDIINKKINYDAVYKILLKKRMDTDTFFTKYHI